MKTIIDITFEDNLQILKYLDDQNEISFHTAMDDKLKKMLLLSIASYFEKEVTEIIYKFVHTKTNQNMIITSFVQKKAISRQYHTFFDWNGKNCNSFLGLFGDDFKGEMQKEIEERDLKDSVKAFLELGALRNNLVHQNAATFNIEKTSTEIYDLYKLACGFISLVEERLS